LENGNGLLAENGDKLLVEAGAKAKISEITALGGPPADSDEFYFTDGDTSKKITAANLGLISRGCLITFETDIVGSNWGTAQYLTIWDKAELDTEATAGRNKCWLGVNGTITGATSDEITMSSHGMITGDGPFQFTTTDTLPAGLAVSTDYWAILVDANTFMVATSLANALASTQVDITDTGTGTHTIDRVTRLVVPNGVDMVRVGFGLHASSVAGTGVILQYLHKNGTVDFQGSASSTVDENVSAAYNQAWSAPLVVTAGDYFQCWTQILNDTSIDPLADNTWFAMEVLRSG
jgi:hypothetical protein